MATEVVKQAAERVHQRGDRESNLIRVKEVSAPRGKAMRANRSACSTRRAECCIAAASISSKPK
jgi:hypothetical protein